MRFRQTDLTPYLAIIERFNRDIASNWLANREENCMTITDIKTTEVTPRTAPKGTILRVVNTTRSGAQLGAIGVKATDSQRNDAFILIDWLSGNECASGVPQPDGGYYPSAFEIFEFQIGDRVVVGPNPQHEAGFEGVITSVPTENRDDCIVTIDSPQQHAGRALSYKWKNLTKVEAVIEDDDDYEEPLAEWEKELLEGPKPKFAKGDIAVIDLPATTSLGKAFRDKWQGFRFPVIANHNGKMLELVNGAYDMRPDGFTGDSMWEVEHVRPFDRTRDFRVGDIVESTYYAAFYQVIVIRGVVTSLLRTLGGDIEVKWTDGPPRLTGLLPLGADREHLTLVGTTDVRDPREDFDYEAGQEIGTSDVLADLPMGTVVIVNGDTRSPVVKLEEGWGRMNRYSVPKNGGRYLDSAARSETDRVTRSADNESEYLMLAYVPA